MSPKLDENTFSTNEIHVWFGAHDRLADRRSENSKVR